MKKIVFYAALTVMLGLGSCNKDPLDITPDGRVSLAEVFASTDLTEAYLNTCYNYLQKYGTNYHYWAMLAGFSDEAHDSDAPEQSWTPVALWMTGALSPSSDPFNQGSGQNDNNFYERNWSGIRKTTIFLSYLDEVPFSDETVRARLRAEARTLRAWFYFELIQRYGGMPIVETAFEGNFDYSMLGRNSFDECVDFIASDCDAAIAEPNFPMRIVNEAERGRMAKSVAYAIKAKAFLFNASPLWNESGDQQEWAEAAMANKQALDALRTDGYQLFPDYEPYFYGRSDMSANPADKETIYEIKGYNAQYSFSQLLFLMHTVPARNPQRAGACPTQELVDAYEMSNGEVAILGYEDDDHLRPIINPNSGYDDGQPYENRDPRFYASVWYNDAYYGPINGQERYIGSYLGGPDGMSNLRTRTKTGYYLRKFIDPRVSTAGGGSALFKKYRLGELYLSYAEAENEATGPNGDVYDAVNTVRERAGMPHLPEGLTQEEMRERIRRERQVELAYEEHRFWDVRRWEILDQTDKVTTGMEWTRHDDGTFTNRRIVTIRRSSWEDRFKLWPIPLSEISRLPGFEQNPGW